MTMAVVILWGAGGGHNGGDGGFAECILPVIPGETLTLLVGEGGGERYHTFCTVTSLVPFALRSCTENMRI
jgi:hypothetical protein